MQAFSVKALHEFVVKAKANSYVSRAPKCLPSRLGSQDIQFQDGQYHYLDSYYGGTDFIGQEVVVHEATPIWAMNYYGRIIEPSIYDSERAGNVIIESLSKLYKSGTFLGNSSNDTEWGTYVDTNEGDVTCFSGYEWIEWHETKVFELKYHGGLIRPKCGCNNAATMLQQCCNNRIDCLLSLATLYPCIV